MVVHKRALRVKLFARLEMSPRINSLDKSKTQFILGRFALYALSSIQFFITLRLHSDESQQSPVISINNLAKTST